MTGAEDEQAAAAEERALIQAMAADLGRLAVFNAEKHRGLMHSGAYTREMADIQAEFDRTNGRNR